MGESSGEGDRPMIRLEDIGSLTDFSRNTKAHLKRLKRTGRPELLTVNGKAQVIVQDASAYERLVESLAQLERDLVALSLLKKTK
jgi:prevent-host-death family protein